MVEKLGWERRRYYNELFQGIERLAQSRKVEYFDVDEALSAVRALSNYFELLRPDTGRYFKGLFRRSAKAWAIGDTIAVRAGVCHLSQEPLFDPMAT
jgi:hypothetical protein